MGIMNGALAKRECLERLASALSEGLFVVSSRGEVLCVLQDKTHHRPSNEKLIAAIEAVVADMSEGEAIGEKFSTPRNGSQEELSASLDQLTDREREVLGLICQGRSDVEMSRLLGLSRYTVRNHIAALYKKIGVKRRTAAILWAHARGIRSEDALKPRSRSSRPAF